MPVSIPARTIVIAALAATLSAMAPASAHVTLEKTSAAAGASYKAVFRVGHGCDGSPTRRLSVRLPEGFLNAKPMPKAGWTIETKRGAYAAQHDLWGKPVSEGVVEIAWTGQLSDDNYDEFVVNGYVSKQAAGSDLAFPVEQHCEQGAHLWTEIAPTGTDPHALKSPAPLLRIAAGDAPTKTADAPIKAGSLEISHVWLREPPPAAKVAGGYLSIRNTGSAPDRLVAAETPRAARVELHEMSVTDGIMRMRPITDGIAVPPGGEVRLAPGGQHLMLIGPQGGFQQGASVPLTLVFERAGRVAVELAVDAPGARGTGPHQGH